MLPLKMISLRLYLTNSAMNVFCVSTLILTNNNFLSFYYKKFLFERVDRMQLQAQYIQYHSFTYSTVFLVSVKKKNCKKTKWNHIPTRLDCRRPSVSFNSKFVYPPTLFKRYYTRKWEIVSCLWNVFPIQPGEDRITNLLSLRANNILQSLIAAVNSTQDNIRYYIKFQTRRSM